MMVDIDQIVSGFRDVSIDDIGDDVIEKCVQLCTQYGISETDIADEWIAFSISNKDMKISVEALSLLERKCLTKKPVTKVSTSIEESPVIENLSRDLIDVDVPAHYQINSSSNEFGEPMRTPVTNKFKDARSKYSTHSPRSLFSPSTYSPVSSIRSKKYDERTNSGAIVCRFGDECDSSTWTTNLYQPQNVEIAEEFNAIPTNVQFMFETIADRIQVCQKHADIISENIFKNNDIEFTDEVNCDSVVEAAKYAGRIVCDGNGRPNSKSVLFSYCLCKKVGKIVKLKLNMPDLSIFSGQVVVIEGINRTGEEVIAEKLYTDVKLPMCSTPREFTVPREPLQIIISAGPYSLSETMSYQPLIDLAKYIEEHKPHVVVLIGPIIDCSHAELNEENLDSSFPEYYEEILKKFFASIKNVDKLHTRFVLVSHWREAGQRNLYPTPSPRLNSRFLSEMSNVQYVPDPCILNISGFHVGVTGADVLMHLGKEEIFCSTTPGDRLGRIASHLLQQRNFYPLMPPAEELTTDADLLLKHALMPFKPHMLVLPSELRFFVKNVYGCVVVNPEKLTKGQVGGNFARIEVRSSLGNENWTPESHVSVQILKI